AGSSVAKATLRLYVDGVVTGGGFDVYNLPATPGWSENTLKYSTPPPARSVSATGGHPIVVSVSSLNKFLSIDMTAAVQGWLRNPSSNNGVALAVTGNTGLFSFDSKESLLPSHVPELEIVLEDPVDAGDEPRMIHIKAHCTNGLACASGACPTTHSDGLGRTITTASRSTPTLRRRRSKQAPPMKSRSEGQAPMSAVAGFARTTRSCLCARRTRPGIRFLVGATKDRRRAKSVAPIVHGSNPARGTSRRLSI